MLNIESQFRSGVVEQPWDKRNLIFEEALGASPVKIDWVTGYDIRNEIGADIPYKHQGTSLSCVGQAWSYYAWCKQVKEAMEFYKMTFQELQENYPKELDVLSAKSVYSQIHLPGGGAYVSAGGARLIKWGIVPESVVSSYQNGSTPGEEFMEEDTWLNDDVTKQAEAFSGSEYRVIRAKENMDLFAQAIQENGGVVGGVTGQNGRGWLTERPQIPLPGKETWGHCIPYLAYGKDEYGEYCATPNSWGDLLGKKWEPGAPPGYGWQKLYKDYFVEGLQFDPFTYTDKLNTNRKTMRPLIKGSNKPEIYYIGMDGKLRHIYSMPALREGEKSGLWEAFDEAKHTKPQAEVDAMVKSYDVGFLI